MASAESIACLDECSTVLGAIAGDIAGSAREWHRVSSRDFDLFPPRSVFTDDSVLTVAVAEAILLARKNGSSEPDYRSAIYAYGRKWPGRGYGGMFQTWLASPAPKPYDSYGNGSAMRVSAVGWAFNDEATVLREAERSAEGTHNHPEGIKGAQAVALAIFLARNKATKETVRSRIVTDFSYDLSRTVEDIQPGYSFDVTCQGSVPEAIIAFLDSTDFESALRNAIWLGGDADTQACIAGSIAEAFYGGVPPTVEAEVRTRLAKKLLDTVDEFTRCFTPR